MAHIKVTKRKYKVRKSKTTKQGNRRRCNTCGRYM